VLRGLSPKERAKLIIEKCSNPEYKPLLTDYLARAERLSYGKHTPHLLTESLGWRNRYLRGRNMRVREETESGFLAVCVVAFLSPLRGLFILY
jgi:succinyl-CoA:acetate CoA-transferase